MTEPMEAGRGGAAGARRTLNRDELVRVGLARCELFASMDQAAIMRLGEACALVRFPRRQLLYSQHEPAEAVFVLISGRVRVMRAGMGDRALTVAYRVPTEVVGETSMVDEGNFHDTAIATEQVEAVRIPLALVQRLLRKDPEFALGVMSLMIGRRLEAERRVESLLSRTVESRVAEFLLDASERHGIPESRGLLIGVKYTHQEIADYVGSTRETVTLTLGELKRRGMILFEHRRVVVVEPATLRALV